MYYNMHLNNIFQIDKCVSRTLGPQFTLVMKISKHPIISCTPDRNCHTFCMGDKIASHPGVLTQAKCAKTKYAKP